jgi:hypothetical protein
MILFNYLAFTKNTKLKLNDEIQDYIWVSYKDYKLKTINKELIVNDYTKKLIDIIFK